MKKVLFLAAAAFVALAACTKVEKAAEPDQAIGFQVATYSAQTKADESSIIKIDGQKSFQTYAYYHVNGGKAQTFMEDVTVKYNGSNEWAPARTYYWPKTGYINFYSFYGSQTPSVSDGTMKYESKTIVGKDNIVFANPALGQTTNLEKYKLDGVTSGVPTLFHHALCQIAFDIKASKIADDDNTTWTITVGSAELDVNNKGTLDLSCDAPTAVTATANNDDWKINVDETTNIYVGWKNEKGKETITMTALGDASLTTEAQTLLAYRSAMPQVIDTDNEFRITYTISTKYNGTEYSNETITANINLKDFKNDKEESLTEWRMNKKIIYHITIDPSTNKLTFDPAIYNWEDVDAGSVTLK